MESLFRFLLAAGVRHEDGRTERRRGGRGRYEPIRSDNRVPEWIDALALGLVLYFRDAGSVLLLLELATHLGGILDARRSEGCLWDLDRWKSWGRIPQIRTGHLLELTIFSGLALVLSLSSRAN